MQYIFWCPPKCHIPKSDAEFRCPLQLILANLTRQCTSAWRLALALLSAACALLGASEDDGIYVHAIGSK